MSLLAYRSNQYFQDFRNQIESVNGNKRGTLYELPMGAHAVSHQGSVPIGQAAVFQKIGDHTNYGLQIGDAKLKSLEVHSSWMDLKLSTYLLKEFTLFTKAAHF